MRSLLSILAALLFATLPALAQETAAPADPALAAMEQAALDLLIQQTYFGGKDFDRNGNGRCDPEERKALLLEFILNLEYDLDGNGIIDPMELMLAAARYEYCYDRPRGLLFEPVPPSFFDFRRVAAEYQKKPAGAMIPEKILEAIHREQSLTGFFELRTGRHPDEFTEPERQKLETALLQELDGNGNRRLDIDELETGWKTEWILKTVFFDAIPFFDQNGDGMMDAKEKNDILRLCQKEMDFNADGKITIDDLMMCCARRYLDTGVHKMGPFSETAQLPFPLNALSEELRRQPEAELLQRYDANQNGKLELEEYQTASWAAKTIVERRAKAEALAYQQLLAELDTNHDQRLEKSEIRRAQLFPRRLPIDVLIRFKSPYRETLCTPAEQTLRQQRLLAVYDANHDGVLADSEAWTALFLDTWLTRRAGIVATKKVALFKKWLDLYDANHNGQWDDVEVVTAWHEETFYDTWICLHPDDDADGDGWLDLPERQAIEARMLVEFDYDHDGRLSKKERRAAADADFLWTINLPATMPKETRQNWIRQLAPLIGFNKNGRIDDHEGMNFGNVLAPNQGLLDLNPDLDKNGNGILDVDELPAMLAWMIRRFDADGDGRLDRAELKRANSAEMILKNLREDSKEFWDLDRDSAMSMSERRLWRQRLLLLGDSNNDGDLDSDEIQAMKKLNDLICDYFQDEANYQVLNKLTTVQKNDLLKKLIVDKDTSRNGHLEPAEMQKFTTENAFVYKMYSLQTAEIPGLTIAANDLEPAQPWPTETRRQVRLALLAAGYLDRSGDFDANEYLALWRKKSIEYDQRAQALLKEKEKRLAAIVELRQQQAIERQKAAWLRKYDFNGNGQLDPEERTRAEADSKSGILAPALDE